MSCKEQRRSACSELATLVNRSRARNQTRCEDRGVRTSGIREESRVREGNRATRELVIFPEGTSDTIVDLHFSDCTVRVKFTVNHIP